VAIFYRRDNKGTEDCVRYGVEPLLGQQKGLVELGQQIELARAVAAT
jgi:hypothetical protein